MRKTKSHDLGIEELISDKRQAVLNLEEKYGARNICVFGSVTHGEAGLDSIDSSKIE